MRSYFTVESIDALRASNGFESLGLKTIASHAILEQRDEQACLRSSMSILSGPGVGTSRTRSPVFGGDGDELIVPPR